MNTPICSFLSKYASDDNLRLHMPGHKGIGEIEKIDLTEIPGADSLYEADGIIKSSEDNASELFGCRTLYSTEGSSLAIRAMLYLAALCKKDGSAPLILAGRNAHKVFVSASALIGFDIEWLYGESASYLCCKVTADDVEKKLDSMDRQPVALYLTSPDYLGNTVAIERIADVCHKRGVLLLVDNAHGAYLAFTTPSLHPIALGADMCADSAHKTLPCLTGAAYLHLSEAMDERVGARAKSALALFGSTSPSYLILASLDKVNAYLYSDYAQKLDKFVINLNKLKSKLKSVGYDIIGDEPMKLTLCPKSYGYTGFELVEVLNKNKIVAEFADEDHLVLMPTPEISEDELERLETVLCSLKRRDGILSSPPEISRPWRVMSPREAILRDAQTVELEDAEGKILADITVGCPPAVPIVVSGEIIDDKAIAAFKYYGIKSCSVIK